MTPYASFTFFLWLIPPILPLFLLSWREIPGKIRARWVLLSTLGMLFLIFPDRSTLLEAGVFLLWEWLIVWGTMVYQPRLDKKYRVWTLSLAVAAAVLPLMLVKINPYFLHLTLGQKPLGFLGISYLSFRTIGTMIEVSDSLIKELGFLDFVTFVLFFPTLASGPLDRYRRFINDLYRPLPPQEYRSLAAEGLDYFFRGLLYKFIIAYLVQNFWLQPLTSKHGLAVTIQYMYAYSLYLFFDFAGYSAFALAVSYFLGIRTPENFNKPFLARNIKDFWNRWHISLSSWFRDFIYMRFMLAATKRKWLRSRYTASNLGYLLLFGLMGFWHGLQTQYIVYGFYQAGLMVGFDFLDRQNKKHHFWGNGLIWDGLAILLTLHFVLFGFLIFSGRLF
ncbi:MAG: D-alanyl-lipoteichoic acid biosynthesis protein DltB [Desulfitobacteriaceae bacterium]